MGGDRSLKNSPRTCLSGGRGNCTDRSQSRKGPEPQLVARALRSVDARRNPAENVWRPASTTDRRDICLLLTPRTPGSWREAKSQSAARLAGRPCVATPLLGKDLRTTFVELLYVLDAP